MQRKENSQVLIAYEYIRDRIIAYTLMPDTALSDNQIAKELGMSRAPIREALLLLQMDGLVQIHEKGKIHVSPISFEDISDILCIRFGLESEAIRLIARNGWLSASQEKDLMSLQKEMAHSVNAEDISKHYEYDDLFHQRLAELSGSPRIQDILNRMRLQMQRARWLNVMNPKRLNDATEEHGKLLDAIIAHNEVDAVNLLRVHFKNSEESFEFVFNNRQMQALALAINSFYSAHHK